MMTLMKEKQSSGRINAIVGLILAVAILTLLYSLIFEVLLLPVAAKLWAMKIRNNC